MEILISILPILALIVCMMGFKLSGDKSALIALVLTVIIGLWVAPRWVLLLQHSKSQVLDGLWWKGFLKRFFPFF